MAYIDKHGVEFSNDRKTLIKCPKDFHGEYVIPNCVTTIGYGAFRDCTSLTSVTIPNSVTSIGAEAFYECSSLTSVTIPNSVTSIGDGAFYGCSGLTSITLPNSITSIGKYAFCGCSGLTSLKIGNGITSIGDYAFVDCSSLISVHISDVAAWCAISFTDFVANPLYYAHELYLNGTLVTDLVIPSSVTSIGKYAFGGCSGLTSVTIPNSVTSIGDWAFYECSSLASVTIPNSVTNIGENAFYECGGLTSVTIPNSVTSIGAEAFRDCISLTSVTIPNSVTSIGRNAFYNVANIIYNGEAGRATNSPWGARYRNGYTDDKITYAGETKTKLVVCSRNVNGDLVIPSSVTSIGNDAFYGCRDLTSVTIPNSVTNIGENAFYGCSGLQKIIIPKGQKERFIKMDGLKELEQFCVEEEDIINEKAAIRRLLYKNNIPYFFHFTSRKNLASIRKHGGLYSWLYLTKHEIPIPVQGGGELSRGLDRYNGIADYVHLSFCESHPMAYHHKQSGEDIVVLKISIEVALLADTKFSDMNAVDSKCRCEQGLQGLKLVNFAATKEKFLTNDNPLFKYKQAEILVKTHVPLEYILNIDEF